MDWFSIAIGVIGIVAGNIVAIWLAVAQTNRSKFKELWDANDKRDDEIKTVRADFQGAIGRIERDLSATIKEVAETLADHRVEDAQKYATRDELVAAVSNIAGEIKGLRADIRSEHGRTHGD